MCGKDTPTVTAHIRASPGFTDSCWICNGEIPGFFASLKWPAMAVSTFVRKDLHQGTAINGLN